MVKHFCDRCNKVIEYVRVDSVIYITEEDGVETSLELCDECRDEFRKWWNNA